MISFLHFLLLFFFIIIFLVFLYIFYKRRDSIFKENLEVLKEELDKKISEIQNNFFLTQKNLTEHLNQLYKEIGNINQESSQILNFTKSFYDILKPTKKRAILGETLLENILKNVLPQKMIIPQYSFRSGRRVDFLIKLPQGSLPIDAKFSLESFRNYIEAEAPEKESFKKSFIESVKRRIDETSGYILPDEGTLDFSFMYVPSEAVYYSIITETDLCEYAHKKRVFIVGPNNLYVYLQTLLLGMKALKIEESSKHIYNTLRRLEIETEGIFKDYIVLGNHLRSALNKYEEVRKKLELLHLRLSSLEKFQDENKS